MQWEKFVWRGRLIPSKAEARSGRTLETLWMWRRETIPPDEQCALVELTMLVAESPIPGIFVPISGISIVDVGRTRSLASDSAGLSSRAFGGVYIGASQEAIESSSNILLYCVHVQPH